MGKELRESCHFRLGMGMEMETGMEKKRERIIYGGVKGKEYWLCLAVDKIKG